MIKIENLNKYFNRFRKNQIHVINNTSLSLGDTGLVALLGPSGSGKTTLLNAIGGLDNVESGNIYINGKKITTKLAYQRDKIRNLNIGYIFQDYKLVENLSVYDNVALVLKMIGIKDKDEIKKRVDYVLEKVGMYRYRNRLANMLSGGERQRVGIARAIVKNPNIIIADEPTGNLDSKNSIEVMNIIKAISQNRLVILVTHEVNLAQFYASRIIEISDGVIVKDYVNEYNNELDYAMDNRLYLRDFAKHELLTDASHEINVYRDLDEKLKLDIVVKNNNIYIKSRNGEKIEVVDESSNIEMLDDNYRKIDKSTYEQYEFKFDEIVNNNIKLKYSSIFNPITFITSGFKRVFSYSLMKKILLGGFFLSGFFIMLSISRIGANLRIDDKDFVKTNKNYLLVSTPNIQQDDYNNYSQVEGVNYVLPGNSQSKFLVQKENVYQTTNTFLYLEGSLSSIKMLNDKDIVEGRMPRNSQEVVVDKMTIDNLFRQQFAKMMGLKKEDIINLKIKVPMNPEMKIVGIVDLGSPSIYVNEDKFVNILYNQNDSFNEQTNINAQMQIIDKIQDYNLFTEIIELKEGRMPEGDYEVIVNYSNKYRYNLNKEIAEEIDGHKLVVVGYYDSKYDVDKLLVNSNMILKKLISKAEDLCIYSKDKVKTLELFRTKYKVNIKDSYEEDKNNYVEGRRSATSLALISAGILLGISLIEILLMLRASFLSRVKEVGIYRAIGVKKKDIYIMFSGEIIAITTIANVPGLILGAYIFKVLGEIELIKTQFLMTPLLFIVALLVVYGFNLLVGLLPVFKTIRKTPAEILARTDI